MIWLNIDSSQKIIHHTPFSHPKQVRPLSGRCFVFTRNASIKTARKRCAVSPQAREAVNPKFTLAISISLLVVGPCLALILVGQSKCFFLFLFSEIFLGIRNGDTPRTRRRSIRRRGADATPPCRAVCQAARGIA